MSYLYAMIWSISLCLLVFSEIFQSPFSVYLTMDILVFLWSCNLSGHFKTRFVFISLIIKMLWYHLCICSFSSYIIPVKPYFINLSTDKYHLEIFRYLICFFLVISNLLFWTARYIIRSLIILLYVPGCPTNLVFPSSTFTYDPVSLFP